MRVYEQRLEIDLALADLDLTPYDNWVAVTIGGMQQKLYFGLHPVILPKQCLFPLVRAVGNDRLLLVETRTTGHRINAWLINIYGTIEAVFTVGDAVKDVIVFDQCIAVTYFDEAFGQPNDLDGVVIFDVAGQPRYRYNESGGPTVLDCYCACPLSQNRLLFLAYPNFPVIVLDVASYKDMEWPTPAVLAGGSALTSAGDIVFFHAPYHDKHGLYRWRLGSMDTKRIAEHAGVLRGLQGGRFLAIRDTTFRVVSLVDEVAST